MIDINNFFEIIQRTVLSIIPFFLGMTAFIYNIFIEIVTGLCHASLNTDAITGIGVIFGFITSFLSVVITQTFYRKAMARWRIKLWRCMLGLWLGVIMIILDLIYPISFATAPNLGTKIGIIAWVFGLFGLLYIFRHIARLETIIFNKPDVNFSSSFFPYFGKKCIDSVIGQSLSEKGRPSYPLILAADESWKPWEVAQGFSSNALSEGAGLIWFWFSRPPHGIEKSPNRVDIDCFSSVAGKIKKDDLKNCILYADPRNPHNMNEKYEKAINQLRNLKGLCVIYDALSDFLYFSDEAIAAQYLRHNMFWEEENNVRSIYIFRVRTLKPELEQYIFWFANAVITLTTDKKTDTPLLNTRGLFREPKCYKTDYDLKICEFSHCSVYS